jgi:hypothetical protein
LLFADWGHTQRLVVMADVEQEPYIGRCKISRGGTRNVVLTGATTHCHVTRFSDPISIKTACYGEVEWRLEGRRYRIHADTLLLLPDGDEYALTIDSAQPSRGCGPARLFSSERASSRVAGE